ncbi:hypothetical protein ACKWTF_008842 [Chironomus riparius]
MSQNDGVEKEVYFKSLLEFAQELARGDRKLTTLGETARFQFFATLPAVKNNLINYGIPTSNDDFDTSKFKILEIQRLNVLFEVDTISACIIWLREFQLFLNNAQFSLALVVDA